MILCATGGLVFGSKGQKVKTRKPHDNEEVHYNCYNYTVSVGVHVLFLNFVKILHH